MHPPIFTITLLVVGLTTVLFLWIRSRRDELELVEIRRRLVTRVVGQRLSLSEVAAMLGDGDPGSSSVGPLQVLRSLERRLDEEQARLSGGIY